MKNKRRSQQLNRQSKKSETEIHKNSSDQILKRKPNLNSLLQRSAEFIYSHNSVFKKPGTHSGDTDTYFKNILRNYEICDYVRGSGDSQVVVSGDNETNKKRKFFFNRNRQSKSSVSSESRSAENYLTHKEIFSRETTTPLKGLSDATETFKEDIKSLKNASEEIEDNIGKSNMAEEDFTEDMTQEVTEDVTGDATDATETEMTDMPEEDDMDEVERMIKQASTELEQVAEENKQLMEALQESTKEEKEEPVFGGSTFKFDPTIDAAVLKELEDAERQAKETAAIINELKKQVAELLTKDKMTEVEARELEEKNKELRKHMQLFEEKTKRIQFLLGQANLFDKMIAPKPPLQGKHTEDVLPKVIVCGLTENDIPKIIVCDDKKKHRSGSGSAPCGAPINICGMSGPPAPITQQSAVPQFAQKLNQSYTMQEKLAAENANLECTRYKLQSDLFNKDQTVECLQRKVATLQNEMRMVCRENCMLNERLDKIQEPDTKVCVCGDHKRTSKQEKPGKQEKQEKREKQDKQEKQKRIPCGKGKGPCPADVETRLQEYSETTQQLELQLTNMEADVKNMQNELIAVQKEREHLEHHRKLLCKPCPHPCAPLPPCVYPQPPCGPGRTSDQQFRELKEQYSRLEDDFKSKVTEVAGLRADNEKLKQTAKDADELKQSLECRFKECEKELKSLKGESKKFVGSKEQLIEQEQQLNVAKQRFREAQDELEELRALIQDQQTQLDDYRNKYLSAQQQVEEQQRQIDMMEMENSRVSEQVNLEIQRIKNQFQEKLQELTSLPDILKSTQLKLQEAQQMHLLAERNNEALNKELQVYKDRVQAMLNQMDQVRSDQQLGADEKMGLASRLEQCEQKCEELSEENDNLRGELGKMEELAESTKMQYQEKLHEIAQLSTQLESVREESARQVARTKDRCETVRRSLQNQISDLERQLAQTRAQARSAQKDRDEIRQKMQAQINNLNENFEDAQMRIRSLQGHVNFLKHSYTNVFPSNGDSPNIIPEESDPCTCDQ